MINNNQISRPYKKTGSIIESVFRIFQQRFYSSVKVFSSPSRAAIYVIKCSDQPEISAVQQPL